MKRRSLTKRERDVLEVLWSSPEPLLVSQFPKANPDLIISSVQVAIRNLVKKELVEVADIVHSGTVLSRRYRPLISREKYLEEALLQNIDKVNDNAGIINIISALLDRDEHERETISEIEAMLQERKRKLIDKG